MAILLNFQAIRKIIGGSWWWYCNPDTGNMEWTNHPLHGQSPRERW